MPSKSINKTLKVPTGDLEIYVDRKSQMRAERLIKKTPSILTEAEKKGTRRFANRLLKIVKRCLTTGTPPPGSGESWPPHSAATVKQLGAHTLMNWTGQYKNSVGIFTSRKRTYVGLPSNVRKQRKALKSGKTSTARTRTLNQVAIMLEFGSRDGNLPPRRLWNPAYKSAGGNQQLSKDIRDEIRKELRKY